MEPLARLLRRLLPALLLGGGVTLLMAGLLSLAAPPTLGDQLPGASVSAGDPVLPGQSAEPLPRPTQATSRPSFKPYLPGEQPTSSPASPAATPSAQPPRTSSPLPDDYRATRIVIPSLRIDLAVVPGDLEVRGNRDAYPLCDVAQYLTYFVQPEQEGTAYIYAHAQRGMFLPMLRASFRDDGAEMIGALVEVYTSDARLHLYEIYRVKRHATDLALALNVEPGEHRLVLQTSEGPVGTIPKLQVAARPIGVVPAIPEEALPEARPRPCGPG